MCAHTSCCLGQFLQHAAHSAATDLYTGELSYNLGKVYSVYQNYELIISNDCIWHKPHMSTREQL